MVSPSQEEKKARGGKKNHPNPFIFSPLLAELLVHSGASCAWLPCPPQRLKWHLSDEKRRNKASQNSFFRSQQEELTPCRSLRVKQAVHVQPHQRLSSGGGETLPRFLHALLAVNLWGNTRGKISARTLPLWSFL